VGGPAVFPTAEVRRVLVRGSVELLDGLTVVVEVTQSGVTELGQEFGDRGDGVGVMAFFGFDDNRRPVGFECDRGTVQHGEFVVLEVDLDEAYVLQVQIVDALHRRRSQRLAERATGMCCGLLCDSQSN
jgi:hypothetical protein